MFLYFYVAFIFCTFIWCYIPNKYLRNDFILLYNIRSIYLKNEESDLKDMLTILRVIKL